MEQLSLWGDQFSISDSEAITKKILKKAKSPKVLKPVTTEKLIKSKNVSIDDKIAAITEDVHKILGGYEKDTVTIKEWDTFVKYIDASIENGIISIDTETGDENGYGSLNTFDCNLMGLCLYTPGQKNAYIPVNHTDRKDNKLQWQITESQIGNQLKRLLDNQVFEVYHNSTFDIEVLKQTCGVKLYADWDTMVGAQLLNENELKGLKAQYKLHINPEQDKYDIEHLFKGLPYSIFEPELFALYAATDAKMTYDLYEYQRKEFKKPENAEIYELFQKIEIPILDVVVDMELTGIEVDLDYADKLSKVYHEKSDAVQEKVDKELERIKPLIEAWRLTPEANEPIIGKTGKAGKSKSQQLADPPELSSPTQMAILLYDVLKAPVLDKKSPRGTGADILEGLADKIPLCNLLVEKRGYDILINTFVDKMPEVVQKDGRVHARFNTCGTQTGRFSSSDPNLQNIPSHAKDVRCIFKPSDGYCIVGSDYSAQEPRSTAALSKDHDMIKAYEEGKDLYAVIRSKCFHNDYWDNLEFDKDGKLQPEGKARRSKRKTILLGITYGMGSTTLAERMGLSIDEANKIINDFYEGFPGVKKLTESSQEMLKAKGYVTDMFGRRRHIPDAQLPEYEIKSAVSNYEFNPLIGAVPHKDLRIETLIKQYQNKLEKARWKRDRDELINRAKKEGLTVTYNGGFINRALRQCLNARIQGTARSMTKLAMIMVHNDPELKALGYRLLVTVHDEMFGECPLENGERAGKRLCEVMVEAAKLKCSAVPWKCDEYVCADGWYEDELVAEVLKDFKKSNDLNSTISKYDGLNSDSIKLVCNGDYTIGRDSIKHGPNYYVKS